MENMVLKIERLNQEISNDNDSEDPNTKFENQCKRTTIKLNKFTLKKEQNS
jgi:hypothetical protein